MLFGGKNILKDSSLLAVVIALLYGTATGYVFAYRGLLSVILLRFILDLKYVIYPLLAQI